MVQKYKVGTLLLDSLNCSSSLPTFMMSKGRELGDCSLDILLPKRGTHSLYKQCKDCKLGLFWLSEERLGAFLGEFT